MTVEQMKRSMEIFAHYDPDVDIEYFQGGFYVHMTVTNETHRKELMTYGWQQVKLGSFKWLVWRLAV
jgi:hypothetical protein